MLLVAPAATQSRLLSIDPSLSPELIREAVSAGELARSTATDNDVVSFGGNMAWSKTYSTLADSLSPLGWETDYVDNMNVIRKKGTSLQIIVTSGGPRTGLEQSVPVTRNKRGRVTAEVVEKNRQGILFPELEPTTLPVSYWVLLYYKDAKSKQVRYEFSLPSSVDGENRPCSWEERILLPPIDLGDLSASFESGNEVDTHMEIDVPVAPR